MNWPRNLTRNKETPQATKASEKDKLVEEIGQETWQTLKKCLFVYEFQQHMTLNDPANNFSRWSLSLTCFKLFLDLLTTTNYCVQADAYQNKTIT